jgi:transposase
VLGFVDETWWSRLAQPALHSWTGEALRLIEQCRQKQDPDPVALACYGLLLRFVQGQPVSEITIAFLEWVCGERVREGKKALLLVWDNASWHISKRIKEWLKEHNAVAKQACYLPVKSPWLNPVESHWVHGKRAIVEPERKLTAQETEERVCDYFGSPCLEHLVIPKEADCSCTSSSPWEGEARRG